MTPDITSRGTGAGEGGGSRSNVQGRLGLELELGSSRFDVQG